MLTLQFGIRKDNLEILNELVREAVDYGVWSTFYGKDTITTINNLKNLINDLYITSLKCDNELYELSLGFIEGQALKKIIIFYLTNNFNSMNREQFEIISDFILFVDDALEVELTDKI
jgi:hypothetical protein